MRAGWAAMFAASSSTFSNLVAPTWRSCTVTERRPSDLLELDQEDLAGAVLVEGDGFGRARIGVGDPAGARLLRRVPVPERQVVEAGRGHLVGRDDDVVALGLAGDRDGAVDHAEPPGRRRIARLAGEVAQRTVRRALRGEHRAVHDHVTGREVDARLSGVRTVTRSSAAVLPASAFRS